MKRSALYALCLPLTAALLAACGGGGTTTTGPAPTGPAGTSITTVNGTVKDWKGGTSTVELLAQPFTAKSATNPVLVSTTLNANGTFALPLPSLATITPYLSATTTGNGSTVGSGTVCTGTRNSSDPSALGYSFGDLNAGNIPIIRVASSRTTSPNTNITTITFNGNLWAYSTRPTTLSGSIICTEASSGFTFTTSYNAALIQGWNVISLIGTQVGPIGGASTAITFTYSTTTDAPSTWYLSPVGAQSLQAQAAAARFASAQATFGKLLGGHFRF